MNRIDEIMSPILSASLTDSPVPYAGAIQFAIAAILVIALLAKFWDSKKK